MYENVTLDLIDYLVMSGLLFLSIAVGLYQVFKVRKTKKANDFLISSPQLGLLTVIFSAIASQVSATGMIGHTSETFSFGSVYMGICVAALIIIPFGTELYLPIFFNLKMTSIFQYLEYRFNPFVHYAAACIDTICKVFILAITVYAPAITLNQVTGQSIWTSASLIGITCIFYTSLGGIKAVVLADLIQLLVMVAVLLLMMIKSCADLGGIQRVWQICNEGGRINFFPSSDEFYSPWSTIFAGSFHFISLLLINNMFMQRYMSKNKLRDVKISYGGTCFGFCVISLFSCIIGLAMYAKYYDCDPLKSGQIKTRDQLMPFFAMEMLSVISGLRGIFIAGLLCSSLSSVSSLLNAVVVVTIEDLIRPVRPNISEKMVMRLSKILVSVYGLLGIGLVAVINLVPGIIQASFTFQGVIVGPLLGVFTAGMLFPWMTTRGVITGYIAGVIVPGWPTIGQILLKPVRPTLPVSVAGCGNFSSAMNSTVLPSLSNSIGDMDLGGADYIYKLSPLWYFCWSFFIVIIVGLIVSVVFTTQNPEKVDPQLLFSFVTKAIFRLPSGLRKKVGFRMDEQQYLSSWNMEKVQKEKEMGTLGDITVTSLVCFDEKTTNGEVKS